MTVYVDHASTALPTLFPPSVLVSWGNPSNHHAPGNSARVALEQARKEVATQLGVVAEGEGSRPNVVFTARRRPGVGGRGLFSERRNRGE